MTDSALEEVGVGHGLRAPVSLHTCETQSIVCVAEMDVPYSHERAPTSQKNAHPPTFGSISRIESNFTRMSAHPCTSLVLHVTVHGAHS